MALPTDEAELMAIAKRIHEKEWPTVKLAALALGTKDSRLYPILKRYRQAKGIVTPTMAAHTGRKRKPKAANGNGHVTGNGHVDLLPTVVDHAERGKTAALRQKLATTEAELRAAMEECHTLQKLLMTVGRAL